MIFRHREVKSKKLILQLEIELTDSLLTEQEAADKIEIMLNNPRERGFSNFIVDLIRTTSSSLWEIRKLEVIAEKEDD